MVDCTANWRKRPVAITALFAMTVRNPERCLEIKHNCKNTNREDIKSIIGLPLWCHIISSQQVQPSFYCNYSNQKVCLFVLRNRPNRHVVYPKHPQIQPMTNFIYS